MQAHKHGKSKEGTDSFRMMEGNREVCVALSPEARDAVMKASGSEPDEQPRNDDGEAVDAAGVVIPGKGKKK